ncbi:hypothetical protein TELCIR_08753 [Teladorsagia circumcincta]|uniref:G-protein coupled receptors family 1 profile domain-containing protein n=1 Tax=Teladorsagia circumcincta TaxID=45464 RepID=A0A2G9UGN8_TELCI|nr:hypothetical protein TELCIR_08753 [Teladorsagia circumcincta]
MVIPLECGTRDEAGPKLRKKEKYCRNTFAARTKCKDESLAERSVPDEAEKCCTNATKTIMELMKEVENEVENVSQPLSASSTAQAVQECYNDQTDDLLLAASMAATVFNVMVIFCAVKLFKRSGDTMHLFILNMTVGDLILTANGHRKTVYCCPASLEHDADKVDTGA